MPALKERITQEMKTALLGGDRFRGDVLRNLKAVILNEEVAQKKRDEGLTDAEIERLIAREVKRRQESADLYRQNDRVDLAEVEEQEMATLKEFMPKQLTEDELRQVVKSTVETMGEVSIQQMGQVIGAVKAEVGSSAEGGMIAKVVKEELAAK